MTIRWSRVFLVNLIVLPASQESSPATFYKLGDSLSCSNELPVGPYPAPDESRPLYNPFYVRSILMLSSYLRLDILSGIFPSDFLIKILYAFLICPVRATYRTHLIRLDLILLFGKEFDLYLIRFTFRYFCLISFCSSL